MSVADIEAEIAAIDARNERPSVADQQLDARLREVMMTAHSLGDRELVAWLHFTSDRSKFLPSWDALYVRVREVLTSRYNVSVVETYLRGYNVPRRDTIRFNTGNLPQEPQ